MNNVETSSPLNNLLLQAQQTLNCKLDDISIIDRDMAFQLKNAVDFAERIVSSPLSSAEDRVKAEGLLSRRLEISAAWQRLRQQLRS